MNEAEEAANKNIKKVLEKTTITYKDWHVTSFPLACLSNLDLYFNGHHRFFLVYGMEELLPVDMRFQRYVFSWRSSWRKLIVFKRVTNS